MTEQARHDAALPGSLADAVDARGDAGPIRIKSEDLFRQLREVEIDHRGRIYRLRLTQLNKLILTA